MAINLSPAPKVVTVSTAPFLYVEKHGPFQKTAPEAWKELMPQIELLTDKSIIDCGAGLSRIDRSKEGDEAFIMQAGFILKSTPASIPGTLKIKNIEAGKYASFLLMGSYSQLPEAYPAGFIMLEKAGLKMRHAFCIEKYLNNPMTTPEDKLETEILMPIE